MTAVFVDTNVFMHYHPLDQIEWRGLIDSQNVRIIVPWPVIQELDKHKDQHPNVKLRHRARERLLQLERWGERARLSEGIELELQLNVAIEKNDSLLDPEKPDDQICAAMEQYRRLSKDKDVILVSHDVGPRIAARARGFTVLELPDKYRLRSEPDPLRKENEDLKRQLQRVTNALPKLRLAFHQNGEVLDSIILDVTEVPLLAEDAILAAVEKEKRNRPHLRTTPGNTLASLDFSYSNFSLADIEDYNQRLDTYYGRYRNYLIKRQYERQTEALTLLLPLALVNGGGKPAEDVDVYLHFPDGFTLVKEDELAGPENPPTPPERPLTVAEKHLNNLSSPHIDFSRLFDTQIPDFNPVLDFVPSNVSDFDIKKTNSYDVELNVRSIKHGTHLEFSPLYLVFDDFHGAGSFHIDYELHAANLPDLIRGQLHVRVNKQSV